jgi:hypothetical protein
MDNYPDAVGGLVRPKTAQRKAISKCRLEAGTDSEWDRGKAVTWKS